MDEEITITTSRSHWIDLITDLEAWAGELRGGIYGMCDDLEPGSIELIKLLREKGVR